MSISLVQTNVLDFHEIPGRRRQFTRGKFDVLTQVFIGPTRLKDIYIPAIDSQNGFGYPFMLVTGVSDTDKPGGLTEITVTYTGQMNINGFTSPPVISSRQAETSGSYQIEGSMVTNPGTIKFTIANANGWSMVGNTIVKGPDGTSPVWIPESTIGRTVKIGTYTVNVRYLSKQAVFTYQSLKRLSSPIMGSKASSIAGYTTLSEERAPLSGENSVDGHPAVSVVADFSFNLMCSDWSQDQVAYTLFDCSETWEYKWIGSVIWTVTS